MEIIDIAKILEILPTKSIMDWSPTKCCKSMIRFSSSITHASPTCFVAIIFDFVFVAPLCFLR
uniref:Uncharacterized protein n=1 Tax=Anguilla anguilla TaxID=7936 RepID=A0A0E9REQ1_ANGAN